MDNNDFSSLNSKIQQIPIVKTISQSGTVSFSMVGNTKQSQTVTFEKVFCEMPEILFSFTGTYGAGNDFSWVFASLSSKSLGGCTFTVDNQHSGDRKGYISWTATGKAEVSIDEF